MRREMTHSAVTRFAEPLATEAQSRSRIADGSARNEGLNSGSKPGIVCAKYSQAGMAVVALPRPGIRSEWACSEPRPSHSRRIRQEVLDSNQGRIRLRHWRR